MPRQARNMPSFASTASGYLLLSAGSWLVASLAFAEDFPTFEYHEIARIGNHMGQTSLVDVDQDGKLDWIVGCSHGDVWWFLDQVSGSTWFRNPGPTTGKDWAKFSNGAIDNSYDVVAADIDGDGNLDVVMMQDTKGLFWYKLPSDPTKPWESHAIGPAVHAGIAPRGVGDIDGDGDLHIVCSTGWQENVDGDGDLEICSKAWNGDLHIYLRNMLVER